MRSLVPETVKIMALPATAMKLTRRDVDMVCPVVVSMSPSKPNIKYMVNGNPRTLEETFAPMVEELRHNRKNMDRTIIFYHTLNQCFSVYMFMQIVLGRR